jgi:hypothetical protein
MRNDWTLTQDLCSSLTINNVRQSEVGKLLDALRESGFIVEINVSLEPNDVLRDLGNRV